MGFELFWRHKKKTPAEARVDWFGYGNMTYTYSKVLVTSLSPGLYKKHTHCKKLIIVNPNCKLDFNSLSPLTEVVPRLIFKAFSPVRGGKYINIYTCVNHPQRTVGFWSNKKLHLKPRIY